MPPEFSDLEPFAGTWCLATEHERFAQRMASTMDEMQAFYDAIMPRAEEAMTYLDEFPLDDMPDDAQNLLHLLLLHGHGVVPGRVLGTAPRARHRRGLPGPVWSNPDPEVLRRRRHQFSPTGPAPPSPR